VFVQFFGIYGQLVKSVARPIHFQNVFVFKSRGWIACVTWPCDCHETDINLRSSHSQFCVTSCRD